jgi:L-amino acid N-acyltransferase YncA
LPSAPNPSPRTDALVVRPASPADAQAVAAIYRHHVLSGTGTFDITPPTAAEMEARIGRVLGRGWPWLVAEGAGEAVGYACAAQFRDREGYAPTCESSVYVAAGHEGRGIGRMLMERLVAEAGAAGFRQMVAVVGDSANAASLALHRRLGFREAGRLTNVGEKFGRALDVVFLQRGLEG